ncbi:MAG: hypothetical protein Q9N34_06020 [Aquificota bacterium]|nr:hypothetical protein [Aquificota bacterium]
MRRKLLPLLILFLILVVVNILFIKNLRNLPYANYYILLLAINIDLLALIVITAVLLRKIIKVYLGRRRNILRRKLANILFLYLFIPLLLLNLVSIVLIIHSTKTYLSSKTRALSSSAERVYRNLYSSELQRINRYRSIAQALLEAGLFEELSRIEDIESIIRVPECDFEVSEGELSYTLCLKAGDAHYKVVVSKDHQADKGCLRVRRAGAGRPCLRKDEGHNHGYIRLLHSLHNTPYPSRHCVARDACCPPRE